MFEYVDPFIGTAATDLPSPQGLAATWWWPKPQVGNTHPGAAYPFGMVSACSYSGAYPSGYGLYELNTEGVPPRMFEEQIASGFSHFHQSGTGAIRKYYNYFRVTPMLDPLDTLGTSWALTDEVAEPGYYAATLASGIRCELTVGPRTAVHRYTFPAHRDARIVIDLSLGGLVIPHGATVPLRAHLETLEPGVAQAEVVVEGTPLSAHLECDAPSLSGGGDWRQLLWYDRRLMQGGTRLDFDRIRPTTLRPFGLMWRGPTEAGQVVELRLGFSLRGVDQAERNLRKDCVSVSTSGFEARRAETAAAWRQHLGAISIDTPSTERRTVFSTALYHSLIKPCFAADESPFWPADGPFVFDLCTMWDIYRTQLPLITALFPDRAVELANALLNICEEEGNLPDRLSDGERRRPVLPAGQRAGPDVPGRSLPARPARDRLGLGAMPYGQRHPPDVRRGIPAPRDHSSDHPHPRHLVRLPLHRAGGPGASVITSWPSSSSSWPPAG